MDFPHIVLLPCRVMFWAASFLVPAKSREEWESEWFAEVWYRWLASAEDGVPARQRVQNLYSVSSGCFRDAWWHFAQAGEPQLRIVEALRSPKVCLGTLALSVAALVATTGFVPATRTVLAPLPYADAGQIAVVSRTGRLEAVRRGIPAEIAGEWKKQSHLVARLAMCGFPHRVTIETLTGKRHELGIQITAELFRVLGVSGNRSSDTRRGVWISNAFWREHFHSSSRVIGEHVEVNGSDSLIRGVLPKGFWFLSPSISLYEVDEGSVAKEPMVVVRCRRGVAAVEVEQELSSVAENAGFEFASTAPHAMFLEDAVKTPVWLFGAGMAVALILVTLAHGSKWMNRREAARKPAGGRWQWWGFFLLKTGLALAFVLLAGIELFVGRNQQAVSEALGGPALIWFYIVGCTLVMFASISDQESRCRVCQRLLGLPIRVGCPGCFFLDWSGTEFLCPQGHGVLYVPHHVTCWEEADRWVLLEV